MAEYTIPMDSSQKVVDIMRPRAAASVEFPNGETVETAGPIRIVRESGDADHQESSDNPLAVAYVSGTAGDSVFRVSATGINGGPTVEDVVTVRVSLFVPPAPPLESVEHTFSAPEPK